MTKIDQTMQTAREALNVPADVANNNCVIDGQKRLREMLKLADSFYRDDAQAPDYVVAAVDGLASWVNHAKANRREVAA